MVAGWHREVNVPSVTQVRQDLLVPLVAGFTAAVSISWSTNGRWNSGGHRGTWGPTVTWRAWIVRRRSDGGYLPSVGWQPCTC